MKNVFQVIKPKTNICISVVHVYLKPQKQKFSNFEFSLKLPKNIYLSKTKSNIHYQSSFDMIYLFLVQIIMMSNKFSNLQLIYILKKKRWFLSFLIKSPRYTGSIFSIFFVKKKITWKMTINKKNSINNHIYLVSK